MSGVKQHQPAPQATVQADDTHKRPFLDEVIEATVQRLEEVTGRCRDELHNAGDGFRQAIVMSKSIGYLSSLLTDEVMGKFVMPLMNTRLGFLTDRDPTKPTKNNDPPPKPYTVAAVRNVIVEGLLRGVDWTNNQLNIIGGNLYITQEGYRKKLADYHGLTDLEVIYGVPQLVGGRQVVRVSVRWKLNGRQDELTDDKGQPGREFAVTTNNYTTADAMVGKAIRKALKSAYERVSGTVEPDVDGSVGEQQTTSAVTTLQRKLTDLAGKRAEPAPDHPGGMLFEGAERVEA